MIGKFIIQRWAVGRAVVAPEQAPESVPSDSGRAFAERQIYLVETCAIGGIDPHSCAPAAAIAGTYTISANGDGSMTITSANLGSVANLKIYMTDPLLNLNDPNNPNGGGGALVLDIRRRRAVG